MVKKKKKKKERLKLKKDILSLSKDGFDIEMRERGEPTHRKECFRKESARVS